MSIAPSVLAGRSEDFVYSLSIAGGLTVPLTVDQIVPRTIALNGAITANILVTFPIVAGDAGARWHIINGTSGSFTVTIQAASGGTSVVVAQNKATRIYWDGSGFSAENSDTVLAGAATSGVNSNITGLNGLTAGIVGTGGILFDSIAGNNVALSQGYLSKTLPSDANYTLSAAEQSVGTLDILPPGGGLTATRNIILPLVAGAKLLVYNGTTQSLVFKGATGTGITVATLKSRTLGSDGVNWYSYGPDQIRTA